MGLKLPQALPSLDGARGRIVRIVYLLLALVTIAAVAASLLFNGLDYFRNMPNAASFGFRTSTYPEGVRVETAGPAAASHGLRDGDRLLAVDGRVVTDGTEFDVGAALGRAGDRTALLVERDGGRHRVTLTRQPSSWSMVTPSGLPLWLFSALSYVSVQFFSLFMLTASWLLFLRRPRDPEALLFAFSFLLICYRGDALWWASPILGIPAAPLELVNYYGWLACGIAIAVFPDGRLATRLSRVAVASILIVAFVLTPLPLWAGEPPALLDYAANYGAVLLALAAVVLRWRGTADQIARQQVKWAVAGFAVAAMMLLCFSPPGRAALIALGQPWGFVLSRIIQVVGYVALPLGLLVSLLRYRLYDAESALSRSAVFAVLALGLLGVFAASQRVVEALGEQYFGGSVGALAGGIAAGIAAVVIVPMHGRVERWADRRFRGNLLKLRQELPALVGDLRETADARAVGEAVIARVMPGVRAVRAAVLSGDSIVAAAGVSPEAVAQWRRGWQPADGEGSGSEPADPLLPVRVPLDADGCGRVGWLLLGPRPDGSLYGKDEREVLAEVADPVARALHIAGRHSARQARIDARFEALEGRLASLEAALAAGPQG